MKRLKIKHIFLVVLLAFLIIPMVVFGESSSIGGGSGSGTEGANKEASMWIYYYGSNGEGGDLLAGIRMTVVDQNGNMVPGTHTVDFVNYPSVVSAGVKMNANAERQKNAVIENGIKWATNGNSYIEGMPAGASIKFNSSNTLLINNTRVDTYFKKLAATKNSDGTTSLYSNYIVRTGYNRDNYDNYNQHYILVEPLTLVRYKWTKYYGTATEFAKLFGDNPPNTISFVAKEHLGSSICYPGDFVTAGEKNNDVFLAEGDTLLKYSKGEMKNSTDCAKLKKNSDLLKKSGNRVVGNGVGVFYMSAVAGGQQCDINNPEDFHVVDGSDNQDYKSNDKTALCCEQMISRYGEEYVTKLYPICGACPVETTTNVNACGSEESVILRDDSTFECLYKGVSGTSASKYDYNSRESVRNKYKVGTIGTKYCEVYCIDDITAKFPGNYTGILAPGGTFVWPSTNNDYKAIVETTRTCKIRFRQQEWLSDFNNGNASKKQDLVDALKECSAESSLTKFYDSYIKKLNPKLELSYNNGKTTLGPKTLKLDTENSSYSKNCQNCSMNVSNVTVNNVVSMINTLASQITNKVLTISTNLRYVLPDGLYQYVNKKSGELLYEYNPSDDDVDASDGILDTGYSKLLVSEEAKNGNKYDVTIKYSNLSVVSNKFSNESGDYTCKYEVDDGDGPIPNKCDLNEKNHFLDLNGDGKLDSGPNGEDCCEMVANQYGENSSVYKELVAKGWCPVTPLTPPTPGESCEYPADLETTDLATKQKCCAMVLYDQSLDKEKREDYYKKYCTGDPYCPQDCEDGVCHDSPMTQDLRNCMATGKSYNECKIDNCPGGDSIVIYRPISLLADEAFPGVEKLNRIWSNNNWYYYSNWAYRGGTSNDRDYYVDKYITNNRGVKEYELYDMDPMYVIELDADTIGQIRKYNKTNSYDDFNLTCKDDRQCRSDFVKKYATGCGVSKDWYACKGISASRGD